VLERLAEPEKDKLRIQELADAGRERYASAKPTHRRVLGEVLG
jgi:hypothetical protein